MNLAAWVLLFCINGGTQTMQSANFAAQCESHAPGDVVDIARKALQYE
jgi:hypothetical protein